MYHAFCDLEGSSLQPSCTRQIWNEVNIWSSIKHPNIAELVGITFAKDYPITISAFYPEGSLHDLNKQLCVAASDSAMPPTRSHPVLLSWTWGLVSAMTYLHSRTPLILHRNLKSSNIMVADNGSRLLISDFHQACHMQADMTPAVGSLRWLAPEVVENVLYDERTDVYSFAMLLYEMVACTVPFPTLTSTQAALHAAVSRAGRGSLRW